MKRLIVLLIFLITFFIYSYKISEVPVHLNQDELGFSINAYSIAKTGYDENGRFLPLNFWHLGVVWATPIIVYLTAIFLIFLPLTESVIRLPSVFVGVVDVVLIYLVARKWFKSDNFGFLAAVLLLLTPVHFIHSRILLDNLYPVPFVLLWLFYLMKYMEEGKIRLVFLATLFLGISIHTYNAPKLIMPAFFLVTLILVLPKVKHKVESLLLSVLGFLIPLVPLFIWQRSNSTLQDLLYFYGVYNTSQSPIQAVSRLLSVESLSQKFVTYTSYFDPWFLFSRGDTSLAHSTGQIGAFLLPFIVLLPLGFYQIIRKDNSRINLLLLFGFLTSPIAAAIVGQPYRISRALVMLPFAVLIAIYGVKFLINKRVMGRLVLSVLLIYMPIQFIVFVTGYFNNYPARSYRQFNYNIQGAYEEIIAKAKDDTGAIYIDNKIPFADRYWKFYLIKNQKEDLLRKTIFFDAANLVSVPSNSLILFRFDSSSDQQLGLDLIEKIKEPDGFVSAYLYRN